MHTNNNIRYENMQKIKFNKKMYKPSNIQGKNMHTGNNIRGENMQKLLLLPYCNDTIW